MSKQVSNIEKTTYTYIADKWSSPSTKPLSSTLADSLFLKLHPMEIQVTIPNLN